MSQPGSSVNNQQAAKVENLKRLIELKEKQIAALKSIREYCKRTSKVVKKDRKLDRKLEVRSNVQARTYQAEGELDEVDFQGEQVMLKVQDMCEAGTPPAIKYDCKPVELPKLPRPTSKTDLTTIPKEVVDPVPPLIWKHQFICAPDFEDEEQELELDAQELKDIENLKNACGLLKIRYYDSICGADSSDAQPMQNEAKEDDKSDEKDKGDPLTELNKDRLETDKLMQLLSVLENEVRRSKEQASQNRRKIIELCILLKQKEAAVIECSQLLCHIMDERESSENVLAKWQNVKLARYIEYLRWLLIRLTYETNSQNLEINELTQNLMDSDRTLAECLETKRRICQGKASKDVQSRLDLCSFFV